MMRTLCAAGLLCGLGLGAMAISGGCGGPPETGTQITVDQKAKEQAQQHGEKMKEFTAKKAKAQSRP